VVAAHALAGGLHGPPPAGPLAPGVCHAPGHGVPPARRARPVDAGHRRDHLHRARPRLAIVRVAAGRHVGSPRPARRSAGTSISSHRPFGGTPSDLGSSPQFSAATPRPSAAGAVHAARSRSANARKLPGSRPSARCTPSLSCASKPSRTIPNSPPSIAA